MRVLYLLSAVALVFLAACDGNPPARPVASITAPVTRGSTSTSTLAEGARLQRPKTVGGFGEIETGAGEALADTLKDPAFTESLFAVYGPQVGRPAFVLVAVVAPDVSTRRAQDILDAIVKGIAGQSEVTKEEDRSDGGVVFRCGQLPGAGFCSWTEGATAAVGITLAPAPTDVEGAFRLSGEARRTLRG